MPSALESRHHIPEPTRTVKSRREEVDQFSAAIRKSGLSVADLLWADMYGAQMTTLGSLGSGRVFALKGRAITIEQLAKAWRLAGATLPDGAKLSLDSTLREILLL